MKPLIVLLSTFALSLCLLRLYGGVWAWIPAGNIAIALMLFFTAIGHVKFTKGMTMMMPAFMPAKRFIVLATGAMEIMFAVGFLSSKARYMTGILCILFFILIMPANVYAASQHVDHELATYNGKGLTYLWFRIPLQLFLIAWVYFFAVNPLHLSN